MSDRLYALLALAAATAWMISCEEEEDLQSASLQTVRQTVEGSCNYDGTCDEGETIESCLRDCATVPENIDSEHAIDVSEGGAFKSYNYNKSNPFQPYTLYYKFTLTAPKLVTLSTSTENQQDIFAQYLPLSVYEGDEPDEDHKVAVSQNTDHGQEVKRYLDAGTYTVVLEQTGSNQYYDQSYAAFFYLNALFEDYEPFCGDGLCSEANGETLENCALDCSPAPTNTDCAHALDISAGGSFLSHNFNKNYPESPLNLYYTFTLAEPKAVTLNTVGDRPEPAIRNPYNPDLKLYMNGECSGSVYKYSEYVFRGQEIKTHLDAGQYAVTANFDYSNKTGYFYLNASFEDYTPACGDGVCFDESVNPSDQNFCALDCWTQCGNDSCEEAETLTADGSHFVCPKDCWEKGDGVCMGPNENAFNSYADCNGSCGDLICSEGETCPADCDAPSNDDCNTPTTLTIGETVYGGMTAATSSGIFRVTFLTDVWYKFTIEEPGLYALDVQPIAFDWNPSAYIYEADAQICSKINQYPWGQNHVVRELEAGDYDVAVMGRSPIITGAFSLKLAPYSYTPPSITEARVVMDDQDRLGIKVKGTDAGQDIYTYDFYGYSYTDLDGDSNGTTDRLTWDDIIYDGENFVATSVQPFYRDFDPTKPITIDIHISDRDGQSATLEDVVVTAPEQAADGEPCEPFFVICGAHSRCDETESICISNCPAIANCATGYLTCEEGADGTFQNSTCSECIPGYYGATCSEICPAITHCWGEIACTNAEDAICSNCEDGYSGNQCDACAEGYYRKTVDESWSCVTDCGEGYTADDGTKTCVKETTDGGSEDGGSEDATTDGGNEDGSTTDGGSEDGGAEDGGAEDGSTTDGGAEDGGAEDGGAEDGGTSDGGTSDAGSEDGGSEDGGTTDSGSEDATTDSGSTDSATSDSGNSDTQDDADVDGGSEDDDGGDSGCSHLPGSRSSGWLALTALPLLAIRRRRKQA